MKIWFGILVFSLMISAIPVTAQTFSCEQRVEQRLQLERRRVEDRYRSRLNDAELDWLRAQNQHQSNVDSAWVSYWNNRSNIWIGDSANDIRSFTVVTQLRERLNNADITLRSSYLDSIDAKNSAEQDYQSGVQQAQERYQRELEACR